MLLREVAFGGVLCPEGLPQICFFLFDIPPELDVSLFDFSELVSQSIALLNNSLILCSEQFHFAILGRVITCYFFETLLKYLLLSPQGLQC